MCTAPTQLYVVNAVALWVAPVLTDRLSEMSTFRSFGPVGVRVETFAIADLLVLEMRDQVTYK